MRIAECVERHMR